MKYKMIAIDMDGTLLDSNKNITKENSEAIQKAFLLGYKIIIATGRVWFDAWVHTKELNIEGYIVSNNGAEVKHSKTKEILLSTTLTKEQTASMIDIFEKYNMYYHYYIDELMLANRDEYFAKMYGTRNIKLKDDEKLNIIINNSGTEKLYTFSGNPEKIMAVSDDLCKLDEAYRLIDKIEGVSITKSGINNIEIMKEGTNKAKGLDAIARKLRIKKEEIVAIGDSYNDIPMLEYAGLSFAMGNAVDEVKDKAKITVVNNDSSGVARAINNILNDKY